MARRLGPEELGALYARFAPVIHRRARALLGRDADAWDVVQEVFERMLKAVPELRGEATALTYTYRVTTHVALNHLRARGVRDRFSPEARGEEDEPTVGPALESAQFLRRLLSLLPERQQAVAVLHFLDGMTQEEIAETLAVSRKTIVRDVAAIREQAEALQREAEPMPRTGVDR